MSKYMKLYYLWLIVAVVMLFIQAMCDLALPDYMSDIVNDGVMGGSVPIIAKYGLKMIGVTLLGTVVSVFVGYLAANVAAKVSRDMRKDVYKKVELFSNAEFDKFSTASLITRTTNDITQIQNLLVMLIRMVFYAPILGVGGAVKALENSADSDKAVVAKQLGEIMFTCASLARKLDLDAEEVLTDTNNNYIEKFEKTENAVRQNGQDMTALSINELDAYWREQNE